ALGKERLEERRRVRVVADPTGARHVVVLAYFRVEIDLPFLVEQSRVDSQLPLPHLLDRLGDGLVRLGRVVQDVEWRKTLAARISGLRKQVARALGVVANRAAGRVTDRVR